MGQCQKIAQLLTLDYYLQGDGRIWGIAHGSCKVAPCVNHKRRSIQPNAIRRNKPIIRRQQPRTCNSEGASGKFFSV